MKNKNQSAQVDLFTPIYEIFHELCILLFDLGKEVFKWIWITILKKGPPLEQIKRKALSVKATTDIQDALGIDTKNRKEFLLNEVDFRRHSFIVGASGFGKTNLISILQEHSLRKDKPIVFFDPKGDMEALTTFQKICEQYKKPCYICLNYFSEDL